MYRWFLRKPNVINKITAITENKKLSEKISSRNKEQLATFNLNVQYVFNTVVADNTTMWAFDACC